MNKIRYYAGFTDNIRGVRNRVMLGHCSQIKKVCVSRTKFFAANLERTAASLQAADKVPLRAFSDQYLSVFVDSLYSGSGKKDIALRDEKNSLGFYQMSCKENLILNNRSFYSSFYLGPFDSGQSITIGNALRRTLLSELNGLAITAVEIEGVTHEYSNMVGVKDTVLDILLNLKEIVLKQNYRLDILGGVGFLQVRGPGVVRACDLKLPSYFLCVDPDQYIATLSEDGILNMKFYISSGPERSSEGTKNGLINQFKDLKYKPLRDTVGEPVQLSSKELRERTAINKSSAFHNDGPSFGSFGINPTNHNDILYLDPVFTPVTKVNYIVEQNPQDFSSQIVVLEIWTNGSIHPRKALYDSLKKLVNIFFQFKKIKMLESSLKSNKTYNKMRGILHDAQNIVPNKNHEVPCSAAGEVGNNKPMQLSLQNKLQNQQKVTNNSFSDSDISRLAGLCERTDGTMLRSTEDITLLNLSLRTYRSLINSDIHQIKDLLKYSDDELLKITNFGKRALMEVKKKVKLYFSFASLEQSS
jgi:DNA-directed RNA polymerase alpha subunit